MPNCQVEYRAPVWEWNWQWIYCERNRYYQKEETDDDDDDDDGAIIISSTASHSHIAGTNPFDVSLPAAACCQEFAVQLSKLPIIRKRLISEMEQS